MSIPKINIVENIVGNLTLDMKKLFDKGEIDRLYSKMYDEADRIAVFETQRYQIIQRIEFKQEAAVSDPRGHAPDVLKYEKRVEKYRNTRLSFHLDKMHRLLELYVQSKTESIS